MKGIAVLLLVLATVVSGQTTRTTHKNQPQASKTVNKDQPAPAPPRTDCLAAANAPSENFEVRGIVTDAKGGMAKMTIIAFPYILPDNRPVARFWLQDVVVVKDAGRNPNEFVYRTKNEGALAMMNPRAQTDDVGSFTLQVPKSIFLVPCNCKGCQKYKPGELGIGVFSETGAGRWASTLELVTIKVDPAVASNDAGELAFKPAGPD